MLKTRNVNHMQFGRVIKKERENQPGNPDNLMNVEGGSSLSCHDVLLSYKLLFSIIYTTINNNIDERKKIN